MQGTAGLHHSFRGRPKSQDPVHYSFLKISLTREPRHQKMRTFSLKTKIYSNFYRTRGSQLPFELANNYKCPGENYYLEAYRIEL